MQARAHLRLIVSEPPVEADEEPSTRVSIVQPVSRARLRWHWLKTHGAVLSMWGASACLLAIAALRALGWL